MEMDDRSGKGAIHECEALRLIDPGALNKPQICILSDCTIFDVDVM